MRLYPLSFPCLLSILLLTPIVAVGQIAPNQTGTVTGDGQAVTILSVTECQGIDICAPWKFNKSASGAIGKGRWPTGEEAVLTIIKHDQQGLIVTRTDVDGTKSGLTATYTGTFQGGQVVGWYKSEFQGKTEEGPWYWIVNTPENTPLSLTVWNPDGSPPVLFSFSASSPGTRGTFAASNRPAVGPVVLDRYDGKTILMMADTASVIGVSGSYTGHIEGNSITGTVIISDQGHHKSVTGTWRGVFGDARNSEPTASGPPPPSLTIRDGLVGLHDAAIVASVLQALFP